MVRTARLTRIIRIISVVRIMSALQTLIYSIMVTLKSVVWTLALMFMIVYVGSIVFTQAATMHLINNPQAQDLEELSMYWGSLDASMSTLYQAVTAGIPWRLAYLPLSQLGWVWSFWFLVYVSFLKFAVLNVMTGAFCNSAIESARREPERMIENLLSYENWYEDNLKQLFCSLDRDKSGRISIRAFEKSMKQKNVRAWFAAMGLEIGDAWTLFKLIDEGQSHEVSAHDFVSRCMQLRGSARSIDLALLRREHAMIAKKVLQMADNIETHFHSSSKQHRSTRVSELPISHHEAAPDAIPGSLSPVTLMKSPAASL